MWGVNLFWSLTMDHGGQLSQPRVMKAVGKIQCNWVWCKTTLSGRNMAVLRKPSGGTLVP